MNEQKICPYPGLRPFTEDESIYFKGREEHIEKIIAQLEEKKFVMLTGASGDGKSSIVYAGVIPNARAGFFKAKFNNWLIADFRPERSPLKNIAIALSEKLGYNDEAFVEKELAFGFSALIKLYKNSKFYLDQKSDVFINADEKEKKALKRKAGNLFILVDQFEEFFTNAENYHNGKASVHSQAVLNLLLETAKIALAEDLPIYIICTMRSDYIGQCAAFRGLPEYIGFSQFFVPRLKRKEIHQVIEEPAILSGNKISNRLTETLINEIGEGFDQLPVLQHALNQIWTQAGKGNEEMDLIHLAKLSGLPNNYLPESDKQKFKDWFNTIPEFKKAFFKNPSLESVLNAHANELYETACDRYNTNHEEKISRETAFAIIKIVFQCLTKIDASRAVRNRMTLEELTNVINDPEITSEIVGGVLDYFRLQGNTFLKPFIISEETAGSLKNDDVLDITHESLIRNWDLLTGWAKEEHENLLNFLDFNKQLQRWISNDKDKGYLLPIGPLTFFEKWYTACKPNKYWLARYDESDDSRAQKLNKAEETLKLAGEFLRKSARSLFFSRYVLKHGANKLVTYAGIIIMIVSCSFYYYDYTLKQNDNVIEELENRGIELLNSNKVAIKYKALFLINYERLNPGTFVEVLNNLENDTMAFDIASRMFGMCQNFESRDSKTETINPMIYPLLTYMDSRLDNLVNRMRVSFRNTHNYNLARINKFLSLCAFVKTYENNEPVNKLIKKNTWVLNKLLTDLLNAPADSVNINITQFNNGLHLLLAIAPETDFKSYVKKLSPFENNAEASKRFKAFFSTPKKPFLLNPNISPFLKNNEGYQMLAHLYSSDNTEDMMPLINQCLDSLINNNRNYGKNSDWFSFYDIINTLAYYNNYNPPKVEALVQKFISRAAGHYDILNVMGRITNDNFKTKIDFETVTELLAESNYYAKSFLTSDQKEVVWNHQSDIIDNILKAGLYKYYKNECYDANEICDRPTETLLKFTETDYKGVKALHYKKRGAYYGEILKDPAKTDLYYSKAFEVYSKIERPENSMVELWKLYPRMMDVELLKLSFVFLYPVPMIDNIKLGIYENNSYGSRYHLYSAFYGQDEPPSFFNYIIKNNLLDFYKTNEGFEALERYFYENHNTGDDEKNDSTFYTIMNVLNDIVNKNTDLKNNINNDFISIVGINKAFLEKDTSLAFSLFNKLDLKKVISSDFSEPSQKKSFRDNNHSTCLNFLADHLAQNGRVNESFIIINSIKNPMFKRNLLIKTAYNLQESGPIENTFYYLDSIFKDNDLDKQQPKFGMKLIEVLNMIGSKEMFNLSNRLLKDVSELAKPQGVVNFIRGVAYNSYYYEASHFIPENVSSNKELQLLNVILDAEILNKSRKKGKSKVSDGWESKDRSLSNSWDQYNFEY